MATASRFLGDPVFFLNGSVYRFLPWFGLSPTTILAVSIDSSPSQAWFG